MPMLSDFFFFSFFCVRMYHEANDSSAKDLKVVTPLRYSQRIREKMCKLLDTVQDEDACVSI